MSWYYYSGNVVRSIPQGRFKSVAVRPNTKVEILEVTQEVQALISQGVLRRTGKPLGAVSLSDQPPRTPIRIQDVVPKSPLAMYVAEKGVTKDPGVAPQKPLGKPEHTVHELSDPVGGAPDSIAAALTIGEAADNSKRRGRRSDQ